MRLRFQSSLLRGARRARRHALQRTMIQTLDALAQFSQTDRFIALLAALLAAGDDHARRSVRETDGALRLVDVLPPGAARAKRVNLAFAQQVFVGFWQYDLHKRSTEQTNFTLS